MSSEGGEITAGTCIAGAEGSITPYIMQKVFKLHIEDPNNDVCSIGRALSWLEQALSNLRPLRIARKSDKEI